jgi:hypothetical protein
MRMSSGCRDIVPAPRSNIQLVWKGKAGVPAGTMRVGRTLGNGAIEVTVARGEGVGMSVHTSSAEYGT